MKKKIMSIILTIILIISLVGCGNININDLMGKSLGEIIEEITDSMKDDSGDGETAKENEWYDMDGLNRKLSACGIPYKLNDDGSYPEKWTPEYYLTEEYADCDGRTIYNTSYMRYVELEFKKVALPGMCSDDIPIEMLLAMKAADIERNYPEGTSLLTAEKREKIIADIAAYVAEQGAQEYPYKIYPYSYNINPPRIRLSITFLNTKNPSVNTNENYPVFCDYSLDDSGNMTFEDFESALDATYGEGTAEKAKAKAEAEAEKQAKQTE